MAIGTTLLTGLGCALALASACRGSSSEATSREHGRARAAAPAPTASLHPATPRPAAVRAQADADARAFLARWTASQERLDFGAYAALYEPRAFRGVKRTHDGKITSYDFAGWKADRARMFRRKFEVAAEPLAVATWLDPGAHLKTGMISIRFVQRWKSGRYADHGVKVLHLWRDKDRALRITYEDLLNSEPDWDDQVAPAAAQALAPPRGAAAARALWSKLAPTGADYSTVLARLADPALARPMARALLAEGNVACTKVVHYDECGNEGVEWADFDPHSTLADPCLRRRLALWALPRLEPGDLPALSDELVAMVSLPPPERELPAAVLDAVSAAGEALRLRVYAAAVLAGHEDEVDPTGLSDRALVTAAVSAGLDPAALLLAKDPTHHVDVLSRLLVASTMTDETRQTIFEALAGIDAPAVTGALRTLAHDPSCKLAMEAAATLTGRGDPSLLPHRALADDEKTARHTLCMILQDGDHDRLRKRLAEYVGPDGVHFHRRIISYDESMGVPRDAGYDHSSDEDRTLDLDESETYLRQVFDADPDDGMTDRKMILAPGADRGLFLDAIEITEDHGCPC